MCVQYGYENFNVMNLDTDKQSFQFFIANVNTEGPNEVVKERWFNVIGKTSSMMNHIGTL